jgi:hypothetical protein
VSSGGCSPVAYRAIFGGGGSAGHGEDAREYLDAVEVGDASVPLTMAMRAHRDIPAIAG